MTTSKDEFTAFYKAHVLGFIEELGEDNYKCSSMSCTQCPYDYFCDDPSHEERVPPFIQAVKAAQSKISLDKQAEDIMSTYPEYFI